MESAGQKLVQTLLQIAEVEAYLVKKVTQASVIKVPVVPVL